MPSTCPSSRSPTARWKHCAASASRWPRARSSACSGRTEPARPRRSRSSRAIAHVTGARRTCSVTIQATRRAHCESGSVSCSSSPSCSPLLTVAETHRLFAGYYSNPRDVDEVIELVGLGEKRDARVKTLSGGQKRRLDLGSRPRRQSGPRLPRRADDRIRSGRAPCGLGHDPLAALARHDDPPDDALPRRGAAARGSRRGAARRRDRPARHPRRADRRVSSHGDPLPARRRARRGRDERPDPSRSTS